MLKREPIAESETGGHLKFAEKKSCKNFDQKNSLFERDPSEFYFSGILGRLQAKF